MPYKCLSIRQPFAWAVCIGEKTVENKPRGTRHRGLLLIHAGRSRDNLRYLEELPNWDSCEDLFFLGGIIGAVELYDVVEFSRSLESNNHASGPLCYLFRNPRLFADPIPCLGKLGIFDLQDDLTGNVETQLSSPSTHVLVPDNVMSMIRPSDYDACCYQGEQYLDSDMLTDAVRRFSDAIALDQSKPAAFCMRGKAKFLSKKPDQAVDDLSEAIRLDSAEPNYYFKRAECYLNLHHWDDSLKDLNEMITLSPDDSVAYFARGHVHFRANDTSAAIADFDRATTLDPEDIEPPLLKGAVLVKSGKVDEAIEVLKNAREAFPDDPGPSYVLYCAYMKKDEPSTANAYLEEFYQKDGDMEEMRMYFGQWGFQIVMDRIN